MQLKLKTLCFLCLLSIELAHAQQVFFTYKNDAFVLVDNHVATPILVDQEDFPGVLRAAKSLQSDVHRVTGVPPTLLSSTKHKERKIIIIGTIGKSSVIDALIKEKKISVEDVRGKWESTLVQVIKNPMKGVDQALVIAGSDKRGTIYGIYDLSEKIGVSPWYWWADVTPQTQKSLYVNTGRYVQGEPAVQYRGIFLNDEEPSLGRWAVENYGGFTHQFYEKVFELLLRHKANYLWPAMWWASFNEDDPLNPQLADEFGIVMGTSHHEPMNRAHADWKKYNGSKGAWNYDTNKANLQQFWREGIERMGARETLLSMAMRGDGDEAMSEETNIALLEKIVKDQRQIIEEVTGRPANQTPQLWALYKEVQDYYDQGMRVPEDVTLLLCDDNWGNNRKLPKLTDAPHAGGYGIYYHFDYVGGPRNYKWLNTSPIARIWEQMDMAYRYGAKKIWIVNVGDLKPMELPISFFLAQAWNPDQFNEGNLQTYTEAWASQQFGKQYAKEIAEILSLYTKYNGRIKPELLSANTYSLHHYREFETIVSDYNQLALKAEEIAAKIPEQLKDAYYQLVLHPVTACANLNAMYFALAKNTLYATQGRVSANHQANEVHRLFKKDSVISYYYNNVLANGKWKNMMNQTHISYTYWQQPEKDVVPQVHFITPVSNSDMGIYVEGNEHWWPNAKGNPKLPTFHLDANESYYIELFNRGTQPFSYGIKTSSPWIKLSKSEGIVTEDERIFLSIDWERMPRGIQFGVVTVESSDGKRIPIEIHVRNEKATNAKVFLENNGVVSIHAENFSRVHNSAKGTWKILKDHGKTSSAITTHPVTEGELKISDSVSVEYDIHLLDTGSVAITVYTSPTIDFHNTGGLRYAIAINGNSPQIVNIHQNKSPRAWERSVADNIIKTTSHHKIVKPGVQTIHIWRIDPGVVVQKVVVDRGGLKPSYLGPPQSIYIE
jgi:hypothetical protein